MICSLGRRSLNTFTSSRIPKNVFRRQISQTCFKLGSTPTEFSQKVKEGNHGWFQYLNSQGPSLRDFIHQDEESKIPSDVLKENLIPYIHNNNFGGGRNVYVETYGCQMNVSDQEIILSIMKKAGYNQTSELINVISDVI
jgi:hypothetical protein